MTIYIAMASCAVRVAIDNVWCMMKNKIKKCILFSCISWYSNVILYQNIWKKCSIITFSQYIWLSVFWGPFLETVRSITQCVSSPCYHILCVWRVEGDYPSTFWHLEGLKYAKLVLFLHIQCYWVAQQSMWDILLQIDFDVELYCLSK